METLKYTTLRPKYGLTQGSILSVHLFDMYFDVALCELSQVFSLTNNDIFAYEDNLFIVIERSEVADRITNQISSMPHR